MKPAPTRDSCPGGVGGSKCATVKPATTRDSGPGVAGGLERTKLEEFKKSIEEKEESIHFLKKEVEKMDRSRYDICEIFSPPRVCVVANDHGL